MSGKKLCLILSLLSFWTHHNYCAMNQQIDIITINNGLLTEIPKILVAIKTTGSINLDYHYKGIKNIDTIDSLANLMNGIYTGINNYNGTVNGCKVNTLFSPTVVKLNGNDIKNLGSFCKTQHKEAREACRQNKAVFYPFQQGLIIYSNHSDQASILDICNKNKKQLEEMAHRNLKKGFNVYAAVLYPISVEAALAEEASTENDTKDSVETTNIITYLLQGIGF